MNERSEENVAVDLAVMREIDLGMSNYDHSIDDGFEEAPRL